MSRASDRSRIFMDARVDAQRGVSVRLRARTSFFRSRPVVFTCLLLVVFASATLAHPSYHDTGDLPISAAGATRVAADLASGALLPADFICEVDGPLLEVIHDPSPSSSGVSGVLVVGGMPFVVPAAVPIQVGDTPGDFTAFTNLTATPDGFPSFIGMGTAVGGTFQLLPDTGGGSHLVCTASFVLLQVGHPPLIGVVTDNGPDGLFVNGVRILLYDDPRIAPFTRVRDLAGAALSLSDLPPGAPVTVNGDYDVGAGVLRALLVELDAIIPPEPGAIDHLTILRAEARLARNELRVRGFSNNVTTTVSIYDHSAGTEGILLASGVPVGVDGTWEFRGDVPRVATTPSGIATHILARTLNGGTAIGPVSAR